MSQDVNQAVNQESIWRCPNCAERLLDKVSSWKCENNHTFDKAKQGYTNLLLANQKNSLEPGDSADMINARRDFLNAGYYQPLAEVLADITNLHLTKKADTESHTHVLDLGCGDGYYLKHIQAQQQKNTPNQLDTASQPVVYHGMDISKIAVKKSAQSQPNHHFAVASNYAIPVMDRCVDVALCVFAPVLLSDVVRVLKKDGVFIRVYPAPRHLYELKAALYEQVTLHEEPKESEHFHSVSQQHCSYTTTIHGAQDIQNLLAMTPLNWRGNPEAKQGLIDAAELSLTCDFYVQLLEPRNL